MKVINGMLLFWNGEFSNFYPTKFMVDDIQFNCSEQYYMYKKAMFFNDIDTAQQILNANEPRNQKKLGRSVLNFDQKKWDRVKFKHMQIGCYNKFTKNSELLKILVNTGSLILAEASPYDKIWGIGLGENDPDAWDSKTWKGENLLGEVLMSVRRTILLRGLQCD